MKAKLRLMLSGSIWDNGGGGVHIKVHFTIVYQIVYSVYNRVTVQNFKLFDTDETASDFISRWVHRESNLLFTLSSDKDQRKKALLLSVNESELTTTMKSTDKISMKLKRTGKVELLLLAKEGP